MYQIWHMSNLSIHERSRARAGAENLQQPQHDYRIYVPNDLFPGTSLSLYMRGNSSLFEDGWMGRSTYRLASVPSATPSTPSSLRLHNDTINSTTRSPTPPPAYYEWPREDESRMSQDDQKLAISKLRKQFYDPHISNIIRRLGSTGGSLQDDDGKRCAVCLEDFESKQFVTVTPCNHMFHEECIVPWVKSQGKCPVCRFMITDDRNEARLRSTGNAVAASRHGGIPLR